MTSDKYWPLNPQTLKVWDDKIVTKAHNDLSLYHRHVHYGYPLPLEQFRRQFTFHCSFTHSSAEDPLWTLGEYVDMVAEEVYVTDSPFPPLPFRFMTRLRHGGQMHESGAFAVPIEYSGRFCDALIASDEHLDDAGIRLGVLVGRMIQPEGTAIEMAADFNHFWEVHQRAYGK